MHIRGGANGSFHFRSNRWGRNHSPSREQFGTKAVPPKSDHRFGGQLRPWPGERYLAMLLGRVSLPAAERFSSVPKWAWLGDALGVLYGVSVVFLASPMGAAALIAAVVTGQLIFSVVVDHFGWIGFEMYRAGWMLVLGCTLMVGGFTLIAKF